MERALSRTNSASRRRAIDRPATDYLDLFLQVRPLVRVLTIGRGHHVNLTIASRPSMSGRAIVGFHELTSQPRRATQAGPAIPPALPIVPTADIPRQRKLFPEPVHDGARRQRDFRATQPSGQASRRVSAPAFRISGPAGRKWAARVEQFQRLLLPIAAR